MSSQKIWPAEKRALFAIIAENHAIDFEEFARAVSPTNRARGRSPDKVMRHMVEAGLLDAHDKTALNITSKGVDAANKMMNYEERFLLQALLPMEEGGIVHTPQSLESIIRDIHSHIIIKEDHIATTGRTLLSPEAMISNLEQEGLLQRVGKPTGRKEMDDTRPYALTEMGRNMALYLTQHEGRISGPEAVADPVQKTPSRIR